MRSSACLILAAACGGSPSSGTVTVTAKTVGQPVAGASVYFLDADDALVKTTTTDATGTASAELTSGGSVTLVTFDAASRFGELHSWLAVEPGDALVLAAGIPPTQTTETISAQIDLATGVTGTSLDTNCGQMSDNATIQLFDCPSPVQLVVFSTNASGIVDAFVPAPVPVIDGASVEVTGTYTPAADTAIAVENIPADTASAYTVLAIPGSPRAFGATKIELTLSAGSGVGSARFPTDASTARVLETAVVPETGSSQIVLMHRPSATSYTIDLDPQLLADFATAPAVDVARSQVAWQLASTGVAPDYVNLEVTSNRDSTSWEWTLFGPGDASGLRIPSIPADLFAFAPAPGDSTAVGSATSVLVTGGYTAAVRDHVFDDGAPSIEAAGGPDLTLLDWEAQ
ncbi:MAG TPA: hypothetical protein VGM88_01515 [Kofleriaceae bacterium]|jgi:hypothetical protein